MPTASPLPSSDRAWFPLFCAWTIAAISTLGALFLGEVMGLAPCVLCWYQRIFRFPLVLVLGAGLFPADPRAVRYALPLALAGWLVAVYHLLLVSGFVPASLVPCDAGGVSCSEVTVRWLGFITIPLLSVAAFSLILLALVAALPRKHP